MKREKGKWRRGVLFLLLLLSSAVSAAEPAGEPPAYCSSNRAGFGITRGLEPDSSETRFTLGFVREIQSSGPWSIGLETALHNLRRRFHVALFRVSARGEWRFSPRRRATPFLEAGGGWYVWGGKKHCGSGSGPAFCWPWAKKERHNSFGLHLGGGMHFGIHGKRSATLSGQIHPYSTFDGRWRFVQLSAAVGW